MGKLDIGRLAIVLLLAAPFMPLQALSEEAFIDRFDRPVSQSGWRISEYTNPAQWIDNRWVARQVTQPAPGHLVISLNPDFRTEKTFASGELQWKRTTHYGRYEAILQAARGSGLNTAFFLYTGPHRGDPQDEIDFEFLGRDPTKVEVNIYVNGEQPMPDIAVDLGFDATQAPHLYAFEWSKEAIRWYADGRLLHEFTRTDGPLPVTPGQIYLSLLAGHPKIKGWLGYASPDTKAQANFHCVSFIPLGGTGQQCSDRTSYTNTN